MKTGVIIANTGSPATTDPADVGSYLRAYLMDPKIRQAPFLPWWALVNLCIVPRRSRASAERYRSIWRADGSPLVADQARLCELAAEELQARGHGEVVVRSAMSYGAPSIDDALRELGGLGCERAVCLPLYPQTASCVTGSVAAAFAQALARVGWEGDSELVCGYGEEPSYIEALAESVARAGFRANGGDELICSFHAVPLRDERRGDTYRDQARRTAELLAERLGLGASEVTACFQSAFGDRRLWAAPSTEDVLASRREGDRRVFLVCPGFAVDCLETLHDIPRELAPLMGPGALESGRLVWVRALGPTDAHARVLANVLERHL